MTADNKTVKGSCLCGAVKYEVNGPMRDIIMCHCKMCQKSSGHHFAATGAADKDLTITEDRGLKWFVSSDWAKRGFCSECGSNLFWKMPSREMTSILMGSLDSDVDLPVDCHLFMSEKKDYYSTDPKIKSYDTFPEGA